MRLPALAFLACLFLPWPALADDADSQPPAQDLFSYSTLTLDHLREHSDYFGDSSQGNGAALSYDFGDVYLFGQWNKLDFVNHPGYQTLEGIGVGAHQAYNSTTSFYIDLAFLHDQLHDQVSPALNGLSDNYWRVSYGLRSKLNSLLELDAAIFTERNTDFGRRPFGERVGGGTKLQRLQPARLGGAHCRRQPCAVLPGLDLSLVPCGRCPSMPCCRRSAGGWNPMMPW